MNIIDERNVRTIHRKLKKKEYDDILTLSTSKGRGQWVRLLDEGMVVDAGGRPLFYLMKGTLRKYYESLADDYVGSINLGHMDFASFPVLLGQWAKKDLRLVDIGDGREALDVHLRLNEELSIVKDLHRVDYTLGVSAEFGYHVNEEFTRKYQLEILDGIFIHNFAIVGDAGNVNSSGIRLKGDHSMDVRELVTALNEAGKDADLEAVNKKLGALIETEEAAELETEETAETADTEADQTAQQEETAEPEPEKEESAESGTDKEPEAGNDAIVELAALMGGVVKENKELRAELDALKAQLLAKNKAEQEFLDKFRNLNISLSTEGATDKEADEPAAQSVYTDGIGA